MGTTLQIAEGLVLSTPTFEPSKLFIDINEIPYATVKRMETYMRTIEEYRESRLRLEKNATRV